MREEAASIARRELISQGLIKPSAVVYRWPDRPPLTTQEVQDYRERLIAHGILKPRSAHAIQERGPKEIVRSQSNPWRDDQRGVRQVGCGDAERKTSGQITPEKIEAWYGERAQTRH